MKRDWGWILAGILFCMAAFSGGYIFHIYESRLADHVATTAALDARDHASTLLPPVFFATTTPDNSVIATSTATSTPAPGIQDTAFSLQIPFISQAPLKNWDILHEDYCEEASLLMAQSFLQNKTFSVGDQEAALAAMHDWEKQTFGHFESTPLSEVSRIAKEYLNFTNVRIQKNPTADQIVALARGGAVVLAPMNGKSLKNPFFKSGGPAFHMIVVRGETESGDIVVNDPGTQYGESFVYSREVFMNSLHDWDGPARTTSSTPGSAGSPAVLIIQ